MTLCYGAPMLLLALIAAAFGQDAPPAPMPAPTDPLGYLATAAAAALVAWLAEHMRTRRAGGGSDDVAALRAEVAALRADLAPLLARDPSGAILLLRRQEEIHDAACDLSLAVHALARSAAADVESRPRRRSGA